MFSARLLYLPSIYLAVSLLLGPDSFSQAPVATANPTNRENQTATTQSGQKVLLKPDGTWTYFDERANTNADQRNQLVSTLSVEAGLVYRSGDVKPVARTEFCLLDVDLTTILRDAGFGVKSDSNPFSEFALTQLYLAVSEEKEKIAYAKAKKLLDEHLVTKVTTDFSGKANFSAIKPGKYYVYGITATPKGFAIWNLKVELKEGSSSIVLDQNNASVVL